MNRYEHRYAFRLDPATEQALQRIADETFQTKASIMRRYVQEGVVKESSIVASKSDESRRILNRSAKC